MFWREAKRRRFPRGCKVTVHISGPEPLLRAGTELSRAATVCAREDVGLALCRAQKITSRSLSFLSFLEKGISPGGLRNRADAHPLWVSVAEGTPVCRGQEWSGWSRNFPEEEALAMGLLCPGGSWDAFRKAGYLGLPVGQGCVRLVCGHMCKRVSVSVYIGDRSLRAGQATSYSQLQTDPSTYLRQNGLSSVSARPFWRERHTDRWPSSLLHAPPLSPPNPSHLLRLPQPSKRRTQTLCGSSLLMNLILPGQARNPGLTNCSSSSPRQK